MIKGYGPEENGRCVTSYPQWKKISLRGHVARGLCT
ncbi:hypothetical protein MUK42_34337 [Musa troglodytarum]|uniref:Uncharacterized protein n=1 Tax=Musa troglodytarum TaxID=320322 RepID=A0A9E7EES2_9LILI|nr:hypothetical protein MUK42_34337 [Musa troglodytarum]